MGLIIMQPKSLGNRAISERQKELSARIAQFPFLSLLSYPRAQLGSEVAGDQSVCLLDSSGGCSWAPSSHRGEAGRINSPWRWKRRGTSCSCRTCWRDRATTSARTAAIQVRQTFPPPPRPPAPLLKTRRPVESAHPAAGARVPFEPLYTSRGYMSQLALQNRTSLSESDDKGPQIPEDKVDQSRPDSGLWTYKSEP